MSGRLQGHLHHCQQTLQKQAREWGNTGSKPLAPPTRRCSSQMDRLHMVVDTHPDPQQVSLVRIPCQLQLVSHRKPSVPLSSRHLQQHGGSFMECFTVAYAKVTPCPFLVRELHELSEDTVGYGGSLLQPPMTHWTGSPILQSSSTSSEPTRLKPCQNQERVGIAICEAWYREMWGAAHNKPKHSLLLYPTTAASTTWTYLDADSPTQPMATSSNNFTSPLQKSTLYG